ncbi:MAG TPA: alpha/beta hydrolase [Bryobacteraceae bacterium]|nr:alpha/beta hydrolase [Bryobacteraceae bacterium]
MARRFGFTLLLAAAVLLTAQAGLAQPAGASGRGGRGNANAAPQVIPLWPNGVPDALGDSDADKPEITFYRSGRSGTAVVIAPGGAYRNLSMESEGRQEAYWFNAMGVSAFVLRYRLAPYHYPVELNDAQRAIRIVRSRAQEFGIQPDRIGMMGFSAGGHLTATAGTHFDAGKPDGADPIERVSSRPDFLILCYPVISFQKSVAGANVLGAYAASGRNLLGDNPDQATLDNLSDELQVTAQTPPTFLYHTTNDQLVAVENSVQFYLALRKAGVPAEMHLFANGGHGSGMGLTDPALSAWPTLLMNWMRARGLLTRR